MILKTNFNQERNINFNFDSNNEKSRLLSTIQGLEKSQSILNDRLAKKLISNEEYIIKSKEINKEIEKYQQKMENL